MANSSLFYRGSMMKKLFLILIVFSLSGCATAWKEMSDTERQAWIISGAVVIGAALIADAMDSDVSLTVDQCFAQRSLESDCIGR